MSFPAINRRCIGVPWTKLGFLLLFNCAPSGGGSFGSPSVFMSCTRGLSACSFDSKMRR
ncbi:hypothetical protein PF005_g21359 [Phytophthora fragariae]|uniref:Uncharacterized protein n=2 Tax=Phytophthora TaxID=4783 RepID=A0A6A3WS38_9STRA|nr:hypothetical protein PF003_g23707 [Phytophthora fragariae]KAE9048915.1 hypothetical protein PR001_g3651 [Phytophthora rubi]KAE8945960.1 hypothetical protein PF009_g4426 [Phytophthora fragariae]KAE9095609.1 hypothetical protein PF010_g16639 [Phytophthora fragariae]KAE9110437.1 hypothetical protein PF006_g20448 [Phytophthora fragariae]